MSELWLALLPILLAMLISPARTIAVILLLHTPRQGLTALAYVSGMVTAMMGQGIIFGILLSLVGLTAEERAGDLATVVSTLFVAAGIILLTGLIHIFGGFKTGSEISRKWGWEHILLGAVEIGIGLLVMLSLIVPVNVLVTALSFWGFIAGIGLISDAFRLRRQAKMIGFEGEVAQ